MKVSELLDRLEAAANMPQAFRKRLTVDEKVLKSPPEFYQYKVSLANVTPGILTLVASADSTAALEHKFYVMPPRKNGSEVYIDSDGALRVNCRKFFARGFMGAHKDFDDMQKAQCNVVH